MFRRIAFHQVALCLAALCGGLLAPALASAADCVVLLHGLARTEDSMQTLATHLQQQGFLVANINYPSRKEAIESLAPTAIGEGLNLCRAAEAEQIHFVTHSMGGILVRYYLAHQSIEELGRVVMLSPPNQGSEVVDKLGGLAAFRWLNGPAGQQLGTDAQSLPQSLGEADFEVGIITGDSTINPILSLLIPGADDGKVAVSSAKLQGMTDFRVVGKTHTFIMRDKEVLQLIDRFLLSGTFADQGPAEKQ